MNNTIELEVFDHVVFTNEKITDSIVDHTENSYSLDKLERARNFT